MILAWLIIIPFVGGVLAALAGRVNYSAPRWVCLLAMAAELGLAVGVWSGGLAAPAIDAPWIPSIGAKFILTMDGLSLLMVLLTAVLGLMAVLAGWKGASQTRTDEALMPGSGLFHFFLLWMLSGIVGIFLAMDLLLFYFFWEMMIIPLYFLIALWGGPGRAAAAIKMFVFTQVSGLLLLIASIFLVITHARAYPGSPVTFSYFDLIGTPLSGAAATWLMLGFFAAFAVKLPAFPFHTWLPDAHTEAPTAGSVILAGVLIKIGAYGMIRFMVPLFPQAVHDFRTIGMVLAVIGIIYGALMAYAQSDMKRLVAYTSVSHMGFVLLGIFAWNTLALQGVVLQLVCHALSTGALFILVGGLQDRIHTRDMGKMGGLWAVAPKMGGTAMFFAVASLGLPGLGNFVAEFLILVGTWQVAKWAAVLGAVGLVFATVYSLWLMQRAFQGKETHNWKFPDLGPREIGMFGAMIAALVVLGFYPQPLITTARQTVTAVQQLTAGSGLDAGAAVAAGARAPVAGARPAGAAAPASVAADTTGAELP